MELRFALPLLRTARQKREELATATLENNNLIGRLMSHFAKAIYDVCDKDKSIVLSDLDSGDKHKHTDTKLRLEQALGMRDAKGDLVDPFRELFPYPGEKWRSSPEAGAREQFRQDYNAMLRRVCRAVSAMRVKKGPPPTLAQLERLR